MRRSTAGGIKCGVIAGNADSTVTPQSRGASHVALYTVAKLSQDERRQLVAGAAGRSGRHRVLVGVGCLGVLRSVECPFVASGRALVGSPPGRLRLCVRPLWTQ